MNLQAKYLYFFFFFFLGGGLLIILPSPKKDPSLITYIRIRPESTTDQICVEDELETASASDLRELEIRTTVSEEWV